jgi:uncharacterized RDD family membrane protein YckC
VELDDRMAITTPEGIELELQLAGLGSRFIAGVTDLIIQALLVVILLLATGAVSGGGDLNLVAAVIGVFAILFFYPVVFELLGRGQTPGKRLCHLRVVREGGSPVDLPASAVRNLVRIVDGLPLSYLPTVISIVVTRHNQRPGDLAAGTLVVRDTAIALRAARAPEPGAAGLDWDVSAITPQELAAVRSFLARRESLDPAARRRLALQLANGLAPKVAGAEIGGSGELFLERLAAVKSQRR